MKYQPENNNRISGEYSANNAMIEELKEEFAEKDKVLAQKVKKLERDIEIK